jgi:F-type H+-transporting ATPase subunit delta
MVKMSENAQQVVFDIDTQQVAKVYAKALVGAAEAAGQTDVLARELNSLLSDVLDKNPELERILASNFLAHEEKEGILERVFGKQASPTFMAFLNVLSKHGRLDCLRAIEAEVQKLHEALRGQVEVVVQSALPLDSAGTKNLTDSLRKLLGKEPKLKSITDPRLLGGLVVRVGDTVYDGSVATQLSHLRTRLIDRTVEEIETQRERFLSESGSANA